MRVLVFLGIVVLFTLAFANPKECHPKVHKGGRYKSNHHQYYESLSLHNISSYNSRFAFDLYRRVSRDHPFENIVFSPVSISTAFALLSLGAEGQTQSQIFKGLGFNTSQISEENIREEFRQLLNRLNDKNRDLQLSGGNALFISKKYNILKTFLKNAKRFYQSKTFSTDFTDTKGAENQINSYVEKNTYGKIPKLLDSVDPDTILVLINYIYFKAQWKDQFNVELTQLGDFLVNDRILVKVPFMERTGWYSVSSDDEVTVVSIPYKGDAEALFILPKEGKLYEVENYFNIESVLKWKKSMSKRMVSLFIPKFSVSGTINLKETLTKMGIVDVFSDNADLSGITGVANTKVSKAVHKAVVYVNESGTEGSGGTGIAVSPRSGVKDIKFNRSFILLVCDNRSDTILFTGRVVKPEK